MHFDDLTLELSLCLIVKDKQVLVIVKDKQVLVKF